MRIDKALCRTIFLPALITIIGFSQAQSQVAPSDAAASKYKIGFSERFRIETWDNSTSLSNAVNGGSSYTRNRSSLMGQWFPKDRLELAAKFVNEFRSYFAPETKQFNIDEIFFDQLYFKWKNPANTPFTVTLGRQNVMFGEGFVIMDGGPLDGSRSAYFDAVRGDYEIMPKKNLTLFYSVQNRRDYTLPVVNNKDKALTDQNEKAGALYFTGDFGPRNFQAYYIRKDAEKFALIPKSEVNALGERTQTPIIKNLSLVFEWAYEFGKMGASDMSAFGGYAYTTWQTGWPKRFPLALTLGTVYLSGDDPTSAKYEGWDPLYGRWPKWSESYIYTLSKENGVAYWTNFSSLFGRAQIDIAKNVRLQLDYHHLTAPQHAPIGSTFASGGGKHRGELGIARLTYTINKSLSGHIVWENFKPGNYYFAGADPSNWMRIEFMWNL